MSGSGRQTIMAGRTASSFRILEGFVSDTGRAYWIEQHRVQGKRKLEQEVGQVLVRGFFESADCFHGVRHSRVDHKFVECPYDDFARDQVLESKYANQVPILFCDYVTKTAHDEHTGLSFAQRANGPVVTTKVDRNTLFGKSSRLAVGMPVVIVNQQRIESPQQAADILGETTASGHITVVAFRDESVYHAPLARRLMSTCLYKLHVSAKTGLTFRKRGDALFIFNVKEGSIAEEAGLQEFSRVWAINDRAYFESSQEAANLILGTAGFVHLVTDPTGSVDQPMSFAEAGTGDVLADTVSVQDAPQVPTIPVDAKAAFDDTDSATNGTKIAPAAGRT